MRVRELSAAGLIRFEEVLQLGRDGIDIEPALLALRDDAELSRPFAPESEINVAYLGTKWEAAVTLAGALPANVLIQHTTNPGLWSWLSVAFFDSLCPPTAGVYKIKESARYILDSSWKRSYRHLLLTSLQLYCLHGENARFLLQRPLHTWGDAAEQIVARIELRTNRAFFYAANQLYFDQNLRTIKSGAETKAKNEGPKPGTVLRLINYLNQLDCTFDIYGLKAEELLYKLPAEFDPWKPMKYQNPVNFIQAVRSD